MKDKKIFDILSREKRFQKDTLMMAPGQNYVSHDVRRAIGSVLVNRNAQGYGNNVNRQKSEQIDRIEKIIKKRAKKLFESPYVNVRPHSVSLARAAVFLALLNRGDTILYLNFSGQDGFFSKFKLGLKYYNIVHYSVDKKGLIDYEQIEKIAKAEKPELIISGLAPYPRKISFRNFSQIAQEIGAWHMADLTYLAGLVVGEAHLSPFSWAHVVTLATHGALRGPHGGIIVVTKKGLREDSALDEKIDRAVSPQSQKIPFYQTLAGIAVTLYESKSSDFKKYAKRAVKNAKTLASQLKRRGFKLVSGGTENQLLILNLRPQKVKGGEVVAWFRKAGILVEGGFVPGGKDSFDQQSGIKISTAALTTRKMKEAQMRLISDWIAEVVLKKGDPEVCREIRKEVRELCRNFPI